MNTITQRLAVRAIAVLAIAGFVACGSDSRSTTPTAPATPGAPTVTSLTVTSASKSPSSFQMTATARFSDGTTRDVTSAAAWQSSSPLLATVSSAGMVTVVGSGELDINATYQTVSGTLHLLVTKVPVAAVAVTGAPVSASTPFQLTATARLADGSTQDVTRSATWESSNAAIATVSASGLVGIVAAGEADIRATYQGMSGSTHVKVTPPKIFVLSGIVTDAMTAARVAGARVQIVGGGFTATDDQGNYSMPIAEGRTLIEFSKAGYQVVEKELVIGGDTKLPIALTAVAPPGGA